MAARLPLQSPRSSSSPSRFRVSPRRRPARGIGALLLAALLPFLPAAIPTPASASSPGLAAAEGRVAEVVDGDTIVVRLPGGARKVRLVGIDTPEKGHPERPKEFHADEAAAALSSLLAGKRVRLARDREDEDRYGRLLRYVFVRGAGGEEILVNREMVRIGAARAYRRFPHSRSDEFLSAEAEAKREGRGIWAEGGKAEAAWTVARAGDPARVYRSGGGGFTVLLDGMAKGGVPRGEVGEEVDRITRLHLSLSAGDYRREAEALGYAAVAEPPEGGEGAHAGPPSPKEGERPGPGAAVPSPPEGRRSPDPSGATAIPWDRAGEHVGERVVVEGTVVSARRSPKVLHLNFHRNFRKYLSLAVVGSDLAAFPRGWEGTVEGRRIRVRGTVTLYGERPEIRLRSPREVEILP